MEKILYTQKTSLDIFKKNRRYLPSYFPYAQR